MDGRRVGSQVGLYGAAGQTEQAKRVGLRFECPVCHMVSHNLNDVAFRFCAHCGTFPEDRAAGATPAP